MTFFGVNLTFAPMHALGTAGMPRRVPDYADSYANWNFIATVGSYISAGGLGLFLGIMLFAILVGEKCLMPNGWRFGQPVVF